MSQVERVEFTKDMMDYTILAPNMLGIHFDLLINIFGQYGSDPLSFLSAF